MFTVWVLILGVKNVLGQTPLSTTPAQLAMQPIATYRNAKDCTAAATTLYKFVEGHSVGADVICLPTGVSDPMRNGYFQDGAGHRWTKNSN
ncbi:MAG: hypothetical protein GJU76_11340 [Gallionella sp.]|jgi:hypothetical protein|nr:hypothetical protein [Gallionella sp.]